MTAHVYAWECICILARWKKERGGRARKVKNMNKWKNC